MKIDLDKYHHENVKNIVKWASDTFPSGNVTTGETLMYTMLVHIFASMRVIEEYCINMLEDRYEKRDEED